MARTDPTIYMRIPAELKDQLDVESEKNRRSLTAEVVARLEGSFAPSDPAAADALALAARLNAELAMARYEEHRRVIEAERMADYLADLLIQIERRGLTDEFERDAYGFDELTKHADATRTRREQLIATTQRLELALIAAQVEMKAAQVRLAEQQGAEGHPSTLYIDKALISPPYVQAIGRATRESMRSDKTALIQLLGSEGQPENPNPSRTPTIPGANAPKRGLGSPKTAAPKPAKPKVVVKKKRFME